MEIWQFKSTTRIHSKLGYSLDSYNTNQAQQIYTLKVNQQILSLHQSLLTYTIHPMMNRSSFYRQQSQNISQYKIIILGLNATGKTSLLTRYQQDFYDDRGMATLSVDFNITKSTNAWYYYYDTCGQQAYRSIVSHYYKGSDACIITYDVSSQDTFQEISYYYNHVKEHTDDALLYIVGCKGDLQRKVFDQDVAKRYKGIQHFVTSAKTNKGVNELFSEIQKDLLKIKPKLTNAKLKPFDFNSDPKNPGKGGKGGQCCKN